MVDFISLGLSITALLIGIAALVVVFVKTQETTTNNRGPVGPPGPPGPRGSTGPAGSIGNTGITGSNASSACSINDTPTCVELSKLKTLAQLIDISGNQILFLNGLSVPENKNVKIGNWLIYNANPNDDNLYFRRSFSPPGDQALLMSPTRGVRTV